MFGLNQSQCIKLILQVHQSSLEDIWSKKFKKKLSYDLFRKKYNNMIEFLDINPNQFNENYNYKTKNTKYIMSEEKTEEEMLNSKNYNLDDIKKEISTEFLIKWSDQKTKEPHQITIGELKKMTPEEQSKILKSIL